MIWRSPRILAPVLCCLLALVLTGCAGSVSDHYLLCLAMP